MGRQGIRLVTLFGIPVRLDLSWVAIFALQVLGLGRVYLPTLRPDWSLSLLWGVASLAAVLFFFCILLHEAAHALVARVAGMPVHDITLYAFGGGTHLTDEPDTPQREFLLALVGPLANLALAGICYAIGYLAPDKEGALYTLASYLAGANLLIGLLNLLPGFPLDGGRVLRAAIWAAKRDLALATRWAARTGRAIAYLLMLTGLVLTFTEFWQDGLWVFWVGSLLDGASRGAYAQFTLRRLLDGHVAGEVIEYDCQMLPSQLTLDVLADQFFVSGARRCFTVGKPGDIQGILSARDLARIPKTKWRETHVGDVMLPIAEARTVREDTPLWQLMQEMTLEGVNQLPVLDAEGALIGMVTRERLVTFIQRRAELTGQTRDERRVV